MRKEEFCFAKDCRQICIVEDKMKNRSENLIFSSMNIKINNLLIFLFIFIQIIGILGNVLVVISVQFDGRMRRSLTNQLIIRVALCDLLILFFNIPDLIQFVLSN
ncbi:Neuropeptide receptor 15, partial [Dictyocoela muelleri]